MGKIGIFGGTFNPIHYGHLRSAQEVLEDFELNEVIFVPSAIPPHKAGYPVVSAFHKVKMLELALKDNPQFSLSGVELRRQGTSYSVDTLEYYRAKYEKEEELYFVLGIDAFLEIDTWKNYKRLFELSNFIVMTRPSYSMLKPIDILPKNMLDKFLFLEEGKFLHSSGFYVYLGKVTFLDISSSYIRERIKKRRAIKYLLPKEVEEYILEKGLYR